MSILGVVACGLTGTMAWAANKMVVVDALQTTEKLRKEARNAINEALSLHGFEAVFPAKQGGRTCDSPNCFSALATDNESVFTLVVQGTAGATGYRISIDLREGSSGRTLGSDSKECELCDTKDFRKAVNERTATLVARVQQEQAPRPNSIKPAPQTEEPMAKIEKVTPPTTSPMAPLETAEKGRSLWQQPIPIVGMALGAVGAGLLSVGIYYVAVDGKSACKSGESGSCSYFQRDTATFGWTAIGSGVAALTGGAAMLIWGRDSKGAISVAITPQQLWVRGRF